MIRNLVNGLGIPAEVLLQEAGAKLPLDSILEQGKRFPVAEMLKRGWFAGFQGTLAEAKNQMEDLLGNFVGSLGPNALVPTLHRQHIRDGGNQDEFSLIAWRIRVVNLARNERIAPYKPGTVTEDFIRDLARMSYLDSGPLLAKEFLNKSGIHLIFERHLPKTHLDGAALKLPDGSPVVALTLRHNRLDNFWFTLFHEMAHVALHLDKEDFESFFDDLTTGGKKDKCEKEADQMAAEALIPAMDWKKAMLSKKSSSESVIAFAEKLRISPSIPAGRLQYESKNYQIFKTLIGSGKPRAILGIQGD